MLTNLKKIGKKRAGGTSHIYCSFLEKKKVLQAIVKMKDTAQREYSPQGVRNLGFATDVQNQGFSRAQTSAMDGRGQASLGGILPLRGVTVKTQI